MCWTYSCVAHHLQHLLPNPHHQTITYSSIFSREIISSAVSSLFYSIFVFAPGSGFSQPLEKKAHFSCVMASPMNINLEENYHFAWRHDFYKPATDTTVREVKVIWGMEVQLIEATNKRTKEHIYSCSHSTYCPAATREADDSQLWFSQGEMMGLKWCAHLHVFRCRSMQFNNLHFYLIIKCLCISTEVSKTSTVSRTTIASYYQNLEIFWYCKELELQYCVCVYCEVSCVYPTWPLKLHK